MVESLPEDILIQILKRLPVKSLLRFRCVQKSWYCLVQTRYFINLHSHHQKYKNKHLLFRCTVYSRCSLRYDDKQCKEYCPLEPYYKTITDKYLNTFGISNGLICLAGHEKDHQESLRWIYIWNPFITKFKALPYDDPPYCPCNAGIAFGYLANIDDYKVIKLASYYDSTRTPCPSFVCVHVYSLSTNSWKTISIDNFSGFSILHCSVVVNGVAYWLQRKDGDSMKGILCFDIEKEILREIMLPPQCCELKRNYSISLVQRFSELLSLFYFNRYTKVLEILVLEKAGEMDEVWTKKITLDFSRIDGCWWPIGFRNNGDIVLTKMREFGYLSYDPQKDVATELVEDSTGLWSPNVFSYSYDVCNNVAVDYKCGRQPLYLDLVEENLVLLDE